LKVSDELVTPLPYARVLLAWHMACPLAVKEVKPWFQTSAAK